MYGYKITNGKYVAEFNGDNPDGDYLSETRIDCTLYAPDDSGAPVLIPIVPEPEPVLPTEAELLAQAKQSKLWQIESKLVALDRCLPRALEDFWTAIGFDATTLPQVQQDRLAEKVVLREKYNAMEAATTVAEVEAVEVERAGHMAKDC